MNAVLSFIYFSKKNESECSEKEQQQQRTSSNICDLMKAIQDGGVQQGANETANNDNNDVLDNREVTAQDKVMWLPMTY